MNPYRRTAIGVALLFLIALVFDIVATSIYRPILNAPDYLLTIYPNRTLVEVGILLDFVCAPAMILIPILLLPLFQAISVQLAYGYLVFRLFEGVLFTVLLMYSHSLIGLSREYASSSPLDAFHFLAVGNSIHATIASGTLLYILVYAVGAAMFYYLLYRSRLIPRWLSVWGLLAVALLAIGDLLYMFGVFGTMPLMRAMAYFAPPIGLQEAVMAVWLIARGFDPSALVTGQDIIETS
ncbi:MAG: DUF4386 domain-containing protein [Nitrospirota bacterium]